jgi:hypothetical protein
VAVETILLFVGDAATLLVVALLVGKRAFLNFPVFTSYLIWGIFGDVAQYAVFKYYPTKYSIVFSICLAVDSIFQFGVLVEVAWSVLRPLRNALPKWLLPVIAVVIGLAGAAIWPLTSVQGLNTLSLASRLDAHIQETFSILRILFFLVLAGLSQLLSIGWRDRELQIATGFGFYSLVSVAVWLQHRTWPQYHSLDQLVSVSYFCSLLYWVYSFAQQEARRREFTPQMENFLLAVAGNARSSRMAMRNMPPAPKGRHDRE